MWLLETESWEIYKPASLLAGSHLFIWIHNKETREIDSGGLFSPATSRSFKTNRTHKAPNLRNEMVLAAYQANSHPAPRRTVTSKKETHRKNMQPVPSIFQVEVLLNLSLEERERYAGSVWWEKFASTKNNNNIVTNTSAGTLFLHQLSNARK